MTGTKLVMKPLAHGKCHLPLWYCVRVRVHGPSKPSKRQTLVFSIKQGQMRGIPLPFGPSTPVPSGRIHFAVGMCGKGGICEVVVAQIGNFKSFVC